MAYIKDDICFFNSFDEFNDRMIIGFSTRKGGFSPKPFDTMNLGLNTEDKDENIEKNRVAILDRLGLGGKSIISTRQVHGDQIALIDDEFLNICKIGAGEHYVIDNTDGIILKTDKAVCMTYYADCTAIFVYDRVQNIVGAAHSGWKGTSLRIGKKLIDLMVSDHGSELSTLLVGIGPTAEDCCYEVDERVADLFREANFSIEEFMTPKGNGHYSLSMTRANLQVLIDRGIHRDNIEIFGRCTLCNEDSFFSHRRDGSNAGRMSGIIGII